MVTITNDTSRDKGAVANNYTVTNWTEDHALNCNEEAGCTALADVVATLISDLIAQGIIKGTVATA